MKRSGSRCPPGLVRAVHVEPVREKPRPQRTGDGANRPDEILGQRREPVFAGVAMQRVVFAGRCHRSRGPGRCLGRDRRGGAGRYGREAVFDQCGELLGNGHLHTPLDQGLGSLHFKGWVIGSIGLQLGCDDGEAAFVRFALEVVVESD